MALEFSNPLKGIERCPQCNVASPLLVQQWAHVQHLEDDIGVYWATYTCSSCQRVTLAEGFASNLDDYGNVQDQAIRVIYPNPKLVDGSLPSDAQRYLKQAIDTKFAPDASIMMAASAVDAMLKEKGYKEGSLYSRIDRAVSDHLLTEGMAKWAHRVRLEANAVRHADETARPPSEKDAERVVEFASALGDFLFVFTARVDEGIQETAS
ncbi:DUF4145 domain-containing protein [Aminobacter sp. SR38]|jgi:hypothetical protein|uniref:DUF4145 domain-containing protein n=1 Tax=Aminobacter sp. SR38 TaxID=2774562 RepID=UPI00178603CE|nr:DUF4145 domain-containing protein [Aminobacter sp. SR38]QOF73166.1 DUF4145 domain-containing protein [Aminobacter sp. SR38]